MMMMMRSGAGEHLRRSCEPAEKSSSQKQIEELAEALQNGRQRSIINSKQSAEHLQQIQKLVNKGVTKSVTSINHLLLVLGVHQRVRSYKEIEESMSKSVRK